MTTVNAGKANKRQGLSKVNRWLAWLSVLLVVLAYAANTLSVPSWLNITAQTLVGIVPLVHALISMYLFGFPRFSSNVNIVHIYIGYALLLMILISQSLIGAGGAIYQITTWLMIGLMVVHLVLGTRSWMARRSSGDAMAMLHRAARKS